MIPLWAGLSMAAGGLIHCLVWPVFTNLHGPTSFNEDRELLGGEAQLWGAIMEGPSGLLIAAGLAYANRRRAAVSSLHRFCLAALGCTQLFAFFWTLAVRPDLMDRIDGYRIYGVVANVLFGLGWIALGLGWIALGLGLVALARRSAAAA